MEVMEVEISHVAQWVELNTRARNFGLDITFDATCFYLWLKNSPTIFDPLGKYLTLADLRAGISDYIAGERAAGRLKV